MGTYGKDRLCLAIALALAAHTASAQVRGVPEEAAERAAADAQLQSNINAEAAARGQMEASLREAIRQAGEGGPLKNELKGDYAFTSTGVCMTSSKGFNANLTPVLESLPPPGTQGVPTVMSVNSTTGIGIRTFNGDGTGTMSVLSHGIGYPSTFHWLGASGGVTGNAGSASESVMDVKFTYEVRDGLLIITDAPSESMFTKGASTGAKQRVENTVTIVGYLGADLRTIAMTSPDIGVEKTFFTPLGGVEGPAQFRICHRERTLHKIKD